MPFKRLLIPLDGSTMAEDAIPYAISIARACNAEIHLLKVMASQSYTNESNVDSVDWQLRRAEANAYLKGCADRLTEAGLESRWHVHEGRPAEQVIDFANEQGIDLILISAYGKGGITHFPFGGTVQKVIGRSRASFMVVRPDADPPTTEEIVFGRILIPMDGSHRSEWAACQVAAMLRGQEVELTLLQVIVIPEMPRRMPMTQEEQNLRDKFVECNRRVAQTYLDDVARQLQNGIKVNTRLVVSRSVAKTINEIAVETEADMIAISAHGASDVQQSPTGSICQTVVGQSRKPVLVLQDLPNTIPERLKAGKETRQASTLLLVN